MSMVVVLYFLFLFFLLKNEIWLYDLLWVIAFYVAIPHLQTLVNGHSLPTFVIVSFDDYFYRQEKEVK
jgi:1,4-dihydroxy-2-naphthoate octaprenyltransferase